MGLTKPSTHSSGRKETGDIFGVVCGAGGDTLRFISPGQDRNCWGQGHTAMKREQSAGETCSGSPAGTAGQHRATRLKTAGRMAGEHQNEPGRLVVG
jgi:hypothetical protein